MIGELAVASRMGFISSRLPGMGLHTSSRDDRCCHLSFGEVIKIILGNTDILTSCHLTDTNLVIQNAADAWFLTLKEQRRIGWQNKYSVFYLYSSWTKVNPDYIKRNLCQKQICDLRANLQKLLFSQQNPLSLPLMASLKRHYLVNNKMKQCTLHIS